MAGQGVDVGDAVLTFVADTTQLDAKFATVGDEAKAGLQPASDALDEVADGFKGAGDAATASVPPIEAAAETTKVNMRDARGEVALLGEEFGIRLPRHVRTFVAELPGVGEALNAAFSATAVLFIAQAIAQATEKLSAWVGANLIYTEAMKEQHGWLVAENLELAKQSALFEKDKASLEALSDLRSPYQKILDEIKALEEEQDRLAFKTGEYAKTTEAEDQARNKSIEERIKLLEAEQVIQALKDKDKAHDDAVKAYYAEVELKEKALEYAQNADKEELESKRKMYYEEIDLAEKAAKTNEETDKKDHDAAVKAYYEEIELQDKDLEIKKQVLKADEEATEKQIEFAKAHHKTIVELEKELQLLQRLEKELGVAPHVIDKTNTELEKLQQTGKSAAQTLGSDFASALQGMLEHQESFGKAMEAAVLKVIASQAQAWGQYFIGIGTAELLTGDSAGAGVLAEGIALEALAGLLGAAAGGISSGSGSRAASQYQNNSGGSNTSSAGGGPTSILNVQKFADGGLISQATMAVVGEAGPEAVMPLDDPEALAKIGAAIGGAGGAGAVNFNFGKGVISADTIGRMAAKLNKMVARGQVNLKASSSLRINKRSA